MTAIFVLRWLPICDIKKRNRKFFNPPIHEFKVLQKGPEKFLKPLVNGVKLMVYCFLL